MIAGRTYPPKGVARRFSKTKKKPIYNFSRFFSFCLGYRPTWKWFAHPGVSNCPFGLWGLWFAVHFFLTFCHKIFVPLCLRGYLIFRHLAIKFSRLLAALCDTDKLLGRALQIDFFSHQPGDKNVVFYSTPSFGIEPLFLTGCSRNSQTEKFHINF